MDAGLSCMPHYIALIHKEPTSAYGVSFPDVPGVITAANTMDEALAQAAEALAFAAEDWGDAPDGSFPKPRTLDELRADATFRADAKDAVVAAVPLTIALSHAA